MKAQRAGHGGRLREDRMDGGAKTTVLGELGLKGGWLVCGLFSRLPFAHQLLVSAAISTGRCNTLCELLCWRLILQGLARPFVELPCDSAEFCLGMDG